MYIPTVSQTVAVEIDKGRGNMPSMGKRQNRATSIIIHGDGEHPMFVNYRNEGGNSLECGLHMGNVNKSRNSISIAVTEREFKTKRFAEFVAKLAKENGVPKSRILRHKDVTGRACPEFADDVMWLKFSRKLQAALDNLCES